MRICKAYAKWHLEARYFADTANLRAHPGGRAPGKVDTSKPDETRNPELHPKHLLDGVHTARISVEIASRLDATTITELFHGPKLSGLPSFGSAGIDLPMEP